MITLIHTALVMLIVLNRYVPLTYDGSKVGRTRWRPTDRPL